MFSIEFMVESHYSSIQRVGHLWVSVPKEVHIHPTLQTSSAGKTIIIPVKKEIDP